MAVHDDRTKGGVTAHDCKHRNLVVLGGWLEWASEPYAWVLKAHADVHAQVLAVVDQHALERHL